jgi:hypothetical protein
LIKTNEEIHPEKPIVPQESVKRATSQPPVSPYVVNESFTFPQENVSTEVDDQKAQKPQSSYIVSTEAVTGPTEVEDKVETNEAKNPPQDTKLPPRPIDYDYYW